MSNKPVNLFAKWQVKDGHLDAVLKLLPELVEETRKEEGNLFYTIHQSIIDPNTIMLYEGYKNEDAVAAHRASEHFKAIALAQIVPVLDNREAILATQLY